LESMSGPFKTSIRTTIITMGNILFSMVIQKP
jgi:hypothetical protein